MGTSVWCLLLVHALVWATVTAQSYGMDHIWPSCYLYAANDCPMSALPKNTWTLMNLDMDPLFTNPIDVRCAFSNRAMWEVYRGTNDVVIMFEGGGACWNDVTCNFGQASAFGAMQSIPSPTEYGYPDIMDHTNPHNPFQNWTKILIHYCTGDLHIGNTTWTTVPERRWNWAKGPDGHYHHTTVNHTWGQAPVHFYGSRIAGRAFHWLHYNFPEKKMGRMLLYGESAGALAVPLYVPLARTIYPNIELAGLNNAYLGITPPNATAAPDTNQNATAAALMQRWGGCGMLPTMYQELCRNPATAKIFSLNFLTIWEHVLATKKYNVSLSVITHNYDATQLLYYIAIARSYRAVAQDAFGGVNCTKAYINHLPAKYGIRENAIINCKHAKVYNETFDHYTEQLQRFDNLHLAVFRGRGHVFSNFSQNTPGTNETLFSWVWKNTGFSGAP